MPLVLMTAPLAPHVAEELWERLGHDAVARVRGLPDRRPAVAHGRHGRDPGAGQRQGAGAARRSPPAPTRPRPKPRRAPTNASPRCSTGKTVRKVDRRPRPPRQLRRRLAARAVQVHRLSPDAERAVHPRSRRRPGAGADRRRAAAHPGRGRDDARAVDPRAPRSRARRRSHRARARPRRSSGASITRSRSSPATSASTCAPGSRACATGPRTPRSRSRRKPAPAAAPDPAVLGTLPTPQRC